MDKVGLEKLQNVVLIPWLSSSPSKSQELSMKGIKAFFVVSYTSAFLLTGSPMGSQEGEEMERKIENVQLLVSEAHTSDGGHTCLIENHKFKPFRICFIG